MHFKRHVSIPDDDKHQLLGWGSDIFNSESLQLIWRPKPLHLVLYSGEKAVSGCGLLSQSVRVGETAFEVGGIGGVVTPPQHQGKGYARQILREALRIFAHEWTLDAGLLFCRETLVPFYQAGGWHRLSAPIEILQPSGMAAFPASVMVYPFKESWPDEAISIDSLPW